MVTLSEIRVTMAHLEDFTFNLAGLSHFLGQYRMKVCSPDLKSRTKSLVKALRGAKSPDASWGPLQVHDSAHLFCNSFTIASIQMCDCSSRVIAISPAPAWRSACLIEVDSSRSLPLFTILWCFSKGVIWGNLCRSLNFKRCQTAKSMVLASLDVNQK